MKHILTLAVLIMVSCSSQAFDLAQAYKDLGIRLAHKVNPKDVCGPHAKFGKRIDKNNEFGNYAVVSCIPKKEEISTLTVTHLMGNPVLIAVNYAESKKPDGKKIDYTGGQLISDQPYDMNQGGRVVKAVIPSYSNDKISVLNFSSAWSFGLEDGKIYSLIIGSCTMDYAQNYMKGLYEVCETARGKIK